MRKKILSMSIAAVMTAITSTGVMAFDTNGHDDTRIETAGESACANMGGNDNDGRIRAPELTASYRLILENRLRNDIPNITDAQITTKINRIASLRKCAGYQGNWLPQINGIAANTLNLHPPVPSNASLRLSSTLNNNLGDALIFPMFRQDAGWGTEIVVRNTDQLHAIVAKVAVYAADRSEEVLDFNVYLSAADVVRFKIKDGKLISTDGSVLRVFPTPSSNVNDVSRSDWASEDNPFTHSVSVDTGYVVVYGMAQASHEDDRFDRFDMRYHHNHNDLFKNYRRELDACRPGWRNGHQNAMVNGTYTRHTRASQSVENYSVAAPNQAVNCNNGNQDAIPGNFFGDVDASLTGTVRLYNETNGARDMILPATAIQNFTDRNKIMYTEGEISALQDRRIVGVSDAVLANPPNPAIPATNLQWAKYDEDGIRSDAQALLVRNVSYNFAEKSIANQLVITQPYKRVLVQLGNDDGYWQGADVGRDVISDFWNDDDDNYGGYSFLYNVYDEHENMDPTAYTESPHNSGLFILKHELEKMANLEEASTETFFNNRQELGQNADKNGFALFNFTNMDGTKIAFPAVVTQMVGTMVGGKPQINWIYSQTSNGQD